MVHSYPLGPRFLLSILSHFPIAYSASKVLQIDPAVRNDRRERRSSRPCRSWRGSRTAAGLDHGDDAVAGREIDLAVGVHRRGAMASAASARCRCSSPVLASMQIRLPFSRQRYTSPSTTSGDGTSGVSPRRVATIGRLVAVTSPCRRAGAPSTGPFLAEGTTINPGRRPARRRTAAWGCSCPRGSDRRSARVRRRLRG